MTTAELASLTQQVLWASFFAAMAFGALVQRTGFCTMGAVADVVTMGDWTRMRQWGLAGGGIFGFGMVLSSGCASKALVRVGGGNLKALVVVLVLGVAAFATLKGL